ncbi:MAG: endo-1,4-beta-xylanase, partial [Anaerolineae bacterium]
MRRIVLMGLVLASLLTACTSGTIRQLIAGGEPSAAEPSWDCPEQIDAGDYTPIDPPLRDLADARGIYIGGAVEPQHIDCDPTYGEVLGREFNILVSENAFKLWAIHPTEDQYAFQGTDAIVEFAEAHGMKVRGHTLLWYRYMPDWIENATFTPEQWEQVIHDHIATVVGRYKGRVAYWDVLNEAVSDSVRQVLRQTNWSDGLGPDFVDKVFIWAHEADPDALLFYNDYGAEGLGRKSDRVYDLVKGMLERDVPIHGVGLQLHLAIGEAPKLENVQRNIERLGELGLQV